MPLSSPCLLIQNSFFSIHWLFRDIYFWMRFLMRNSLRGLEPPDCPPILDSTVLLLESSWGHEWDYKWLRLGGDRQVSPQSTLCIYLLQPSLPLSTAVFCFVYLYFIYSPSNRERDGSQMIVGSFCVVVYAWWVKSKKQGQTIIA